MPRDVSTLTIQEEVGARFDHEKVAGIVRKVREQPEPKEWLKELALADPATIIAAIGELQSTGSRGARFEAFRDAASALVQQKVAAETIAAVDRLNKGTAKLAKVGIAVTAAGVLVAAAGLVVALRAGG